MSQDRDGLSDQQRASIDDRFVEALLQEAYLSERDASSEEERVKRLMQALDGSEVLRPTDELAKPNHVRVRHRRWVSYVLAGCFLLFAFIWYQQRGPGNRAYAAIEKCLSISPKLREYRLTTHRIGSNGQAHATSMQLYFDDRDRFVLSHPSLLRLGTTWIGGDATHRWIVPPLGPVLVGGEEIVGHWLTRKSVNSPFLHIHSILSRVKRSYRLEWQGEVTIDNPFAEKCQHVKATLLVPRSQLPETIDLWFDESSGFAVRLRLAWERKIGSEDDTSQRTEWHFEYAGEPTLQENWFEYQGHVHRERRVRTIGTQKELEDWNPEAP